MNVTDVVVGKVSEFEMYLATVTCYRDFPQLLLQAESIQKFVEPCRHVIIINQDNPDIDFYYRWLKPYYTNHELVVIPKIDYYYPVKGLQTSLVLMGTSLEWRIQQLQKLLLAYEFDDNYVLLDSKNFFVKPININYWNNPDIIGSGKLHCNDAWNKSCADTYRKILNVTDKLTLSPGTPFKIDKDLLTKRCKKEELGYFLFAPEFNSSVTSEFTFYSVLINDKLQQCINWPAKGVEHVLWENSINSLQHDLDIIQKDPDIYVSGFHRDLLSLTSAEDHRMINSWLKFAIGLENKIYPIPKDPEMSVHPRKDAPSN